MRIRLLTAVAVVALARASSALAAPPTPDGLLDRARTTMGRGDYRAALAMLEPLTRATDLTPIQHARL